jgi:twitching motility protein PilI
MARKIPLREFHQQVLRRLESAAAARDTPVSKLGVEIGEENWLVDLASISEVVPVPNVVPVPLTHSWFRGVANVRGSLYGITDFAALAGGGPTPPALDNRILLAHPRFGVNAAILVRKVFGLRNPAQFEVLETTGERTPWLAREYRDEEGALWREMDLGSLMRYPDFLNVGIYRRMDVFTSAAQEHPAA